MKKTYLSLIVSILVLSSCFGNPQKVDEPENIIGDLFDSVLAETGALTHTDNGDEMDMLQEMRDCDASMTEAEKQRCEMLAQETSMQGSNKCDDLTSPEAKLLCHDNYIFNHAISSLEGELCEEITQTNLSQRCFAHIALQKAITEGDSSYCDQLVDSVEQEHCQELFGEINDS